MATSPAGAARCAQAECIASRNELELCRRDLEELEGEFDQLHEQLAAKESDCGALRQREQQAADKAQRRGEQLALKDAEIVRLENALAELDATVQRLQQQVRSSGSDSGGDNKPAGVDTSAASDALMAENAALTATVKELRAAIARETAASAHANQHVAKSQQESKGKRDELYQALKENELLRRERQERDEALEKVSQLALDYELALKALQEQQRDYLEALEVMRIDNAQQRTRIDQLEKEKETVEAKLIEMDEHESQVDTIVKELTMKHDMEKMVLRAELDELRKKAIELRQQTKRVQAPRGDTTGSGVRAGEVDLEELERQLEMVHELRVRDQLKLEEKDREIQQLRSDVESLVEHLQDGGSEAQHAIRQAVEGEARKHKAIGLENASVKRRLKEQSEMVEQLEFRQAQLEKDLVEAQELNAKYEVGAGLEDVMKYQKKLRRELEKQQLANQKLRQEVNDQRDATGKLHVAFERLKAEVGKGADFEYDDLAIENHLKGELAVHKAVMTQLEHQIHELETERIRLLQKLRDQARIIGGKLYELHGLSTDQWQLVEEYIERVKLTPEVAKRWLLNTESAGIPACDPKAVAVARDRDDEINRLQRENARIRDELEEATTKELVQDHRESVVASAHTEKKLASERKNAATSPLKRSSGHEDVGADNEQARGDHAHREELEESDGTKHTRTGASQTSKDPPRSEASEQPSAEFLAQAIASALESRLQLMHDKSARNLSAQPTHSIATQPSPSKSSPMDNSLLAFETESELSQQVDFLREFQLLLDEYVKLEGQNNSLQEQLFLQETACKSLMDQQSVVYQHFFHLQDASTTEKAKFQFDIQQLKTQNHELQLKCQRDEATLHTLESSANRGGDEGAMRLRAELVELTRRVAHDEVASAKLKREHMLLQEEYRLSLAEAQNLESEWLEMERALKFRILYLESWKSGAEDLIARTEATLDKCVLKSVVDRKHEDLNILLASHSELGEEYAELHAKYLKVYALPMHFSKLQHENAMLIAERTASQGDKFVSVDAVSQSRITQLQTELEEQVERVKELEEKVHSTTVASHRTVHQSKDSERDDRIRVLETENTILCERIAEVEQLYESLVREHRKAKQDAELAATQAHTLSRRMTQEKAKVAGKDDQLRDLMLASEDHAIVARLQQQLIHMTSNYQQFCLRYEQAVASQQQATIVHQHSELEMEKQAKVHSDAREKARLQILVLEACIQEFKERDHVLRNNKWEVFKKRLDGLEEEMRVEQDRRRALEKELEEKQSELPFGGGHPSSISTTTASEISRLKSRIDSLETRERVLMGQLDVLAKNASSRATSSGSGEEERLKKEVGELKRVYGEVMRQLQGLQGVNADLVKQNNDLANQKRTVQRERDDLEIDFQQLHAQWQLHGSRGARGNNNNEEESSSSPIMRRKVGLYEKDHLEQQQAAQASIASLKQLLNEKNSVIAEYQKKIVSIRADVAAVKAQERADATQLHKKLYEENQRMITQLKEATDKIHHLEKTGSDKKALKAAEDQKDQILEQWRRAETELEAARAKLRELEMEIKVLQNERDIAEARAGEALEEIVLNQDKIKTLEKGKKNVESQLVFVKRDGTKREERMQLLREAIIKLKEEFLKAEDRHAIELAKAQNTVRSTKQSKSEHESEREQWNEAKEQFEAQVQMLQDKLKIAKKAEDKAKTDLAKIAKQQTLSKSTKRPGVGEDPRSRGNDDGGSTRSATALEAEVERLKGVVKEKVVGEARTVEELEKRIKVLQAQNLALRESAGTAHAATTTNGSEEKTNENTMTRQALREQWEGDKRLQRRLDVVSIRLKEKQLVVEKSEKEIESLRQRLSDSESKLKELQRMASSAREAIHRNGDDSATGGNEATSRPRRQVRGDPSELEHQNAFLQEALVLKRKEWEESFQEQMEKYEAQLHRLRTMLAQRRGESENLSALEREERAFVATHDVRDELLALGEDLRDKERNIMEKDTRIMELELELESLRAEYQRLHRRATTSATTSSAPTSTAAATRRIKSSAQERLELEEVVENMKKVIEKLRSENEKLRRTASLVVPPDKVDALRKKLKEFREARHELQTEVDQLRHENSELKKDKFRLQQRVRLLSSSSAGAGAGATGTRSSPSRKFAHEDTEHFHHAQLGEKTAEIAELQDKIVKKDAYIRELSQQLSQVDKSATESDASREVEKMVVELQGQVEALARENDQLRQELSAFDQDFFEEIEDLKYKYAQAVRDKQRLERLLREHEH